MLWLLVLDTTALSTLEDRIQRRLRPMERVLCVLEAGLLTHVTEVGHLWGHLQRRDWSAMCLRLDWFLGTLPQGPQFAAYSANSFACLLSGVLVALLALS